MSVLNGKRVACLTKDVLQKMRNDTSFKSFYDVVLLKSKSYPSMSGPMLPRRTRGPKRIEIGTGEPTYPMTAQDYYRRKFYKCCWRVLKDGDYFCFDEIIVKIKELPNPEREMVKEVITLCKLILVNPATSAAGERSFSTARGLKTRLRSIMNQE